MPNLSLMILLSMDAWMSVVPVKVDGSCLLGCRGADKITLIGTPPVNTLFVGRHCFSQLQIPANDKTTTTL